jgi:hypothetical protein
MPTLTIETIRENPWNVVAHSLPEHPTPLLLEIAHLAAAYCRQSEFVLMMAAREGIYTPPGWEASDDCPDVHEENETRSFDADQRLQEICDLSESKYGETLER